MRLQKTRYLCNSLKSNDLQYFRPHSSSDAKALKRHRNSEITLLQASKEMREPHFPMKIPALSAHMADVEVMYSDTKITNFVAKWAI